MKMGLSRASTHFDYTVLAELIAQRWREDRPYFMLHMRTRGVWLGGLVVAASQDIGSALVSGAIDFRCSAASSVPAANI